jgi:hypothetical protein
VTRRTRLWLLTSTSPVTLDPPAAGAVDRVSTFGGHPFYEVVPGAYLFAYQPPGLTIIDDVPHATIYTKRIAISARQTGRTAAAKLLALKARTKTVHPA